jgi:hypothetical protein
MMLARLELRWTNRRAGPKTVNTSFTGMTPDGELISAASPRRFLDFVVDGVSLYAVIQGLGYDLISCLDSYSMCDPQFTSAKRLFGETEPDSHARQCSLFVCPECANLDCGVVTVKVDRGGKIISWSDIAWEHYDLEDEDVGSVMVPSYKRLDAVGPFEFDAARLRDALLRPPPDIM